MTRIVILSTESIDGIFIFFIVLLINAYFHQSFKTNNNSSEEIKNTFLSMPVWYVNIY